MFITARCFRKGGKAITQSRGGYHYRDESTITSNFLQKSRIILQAAGLRRQDRGGKPRAVRAGVLEGITRDF
jgi:hypothetical protein